jgi:molybdate transport system ATP-binding protein
MSAPIIHHHRPFLSLRAATFRLGDRLVFPNTSWTLHRDEQWAIIGANGAGKSLLADALRGRLPLVQGELHYHFRPPPGASPEEAIGHVSIADRKADLHDTVVQSRWNSLEDEATQRVNDFLSYECVLDINPFEVTTRHKRARPSFDRRRRQVVDLLRLGPLLDRPLLSLSNGERQRVQLGRAFCLPLRLLILDEPFAGLDTATRKHFHYVLEQLMGTPLRVLLLTTRIEDLPRHVTHLLRVEDCRVVTAGLRRHVRESLAPSRNLSRNFKSDSRRRITTESVVGKSARCGRSRPPPRPRPRLPGCFRGRGRGGGRERAAGPTFQTRRNAQPLVQLRHVTVRYGPAVILRDIDWTVRAGESWALLGPNGSGKTTLLSLVLGDNPQAYRNHVAVFGRLRGSGESIWELKRRIGWVSPELHLHFDDTIACADVVASGFRQTIGLFEPPAPRQRAAARQWLARFGLLHFAHSPLYGLSAGLQRMVLLARALVKNPRLLILDEPCQDLDASHRDAFVQTVDALLRTGRITAIYGTHRPEEIPPSIHRILRLSAGRARTEIRNSKTQIRDA